VKAAETLLLSPNMQFRVMWEKKESDINTMHIVESVYGEGL
jgi:hypothetical protein